MSFFATICGFSCQEKYEEQVKIRGKLDSGVDEGAHYFPLYRA